MLLDGHNILQIWLIVAREQESIARKQYLYEYVYKQSTSWNTHKRIDLTTRVITKLNDILDTVNVFTNSNSLHLVNN